ncbi:MAG: hypothetical protein IT204_01455 [Fimbriimonadaceae bacterium]|nr:hypothetical protein [Fimbriimonadaceae bacterium]
MRQAWWRWMVLPALACAAAGRAAPAPQNLAARAAGQALLVVDEGEGWLRWHDVADGRELRRVPVPSPRGLAVDATHVWVTDRLGGSVGLYDLASGRNLRRWPAGRRPAGLALAPRHGLLLVAGLEGLTLTGALDGRPRGRVWLGGQPEAVAGTPDEGLAVVVPLLPAGDARAEDQALTVHLLELPSGRQRAAVKLPAGATAARQVTVSPDGRWAYLPHLVGRYNLPPTQLDRGWVNTNALSIVDLAAGTLHATVLLDEPTRGAGDPWGVAVSPDGQTLWITLAGSGELAQLDLARLHPLLVGQVPAAWTARPPSSEFQITSRNLWLAIAADPTQRRELVNDLAALALADLVQRRSLGSAGWRGLALAADGTLALSNPFRGELRLLRGSRDQTVVLPGARPDTPARRGAALFHDARLSFQGWLSCASCHPDSRADGLNWDLLNDGIGNPKQTRSLVWAARTPPAMAHGVRADYTVAAEAGFRFMLFRQPAPRDLADVQAYLASLQPDPSPYRVAGQLSPTAVAGQRLFGDPRVGCGDCHPAPLYSRLRSEDVGTAGELDSSPEFDTPTLVELWRTAPYLHDGSAPTLRDVLTTRNPGDQHGRTRHLGRQEIDALVAYLLSL